MDNLSTTKTRDKIVIGNLNVEAVRQDEQAIRSSAGQIDEYIRRRQNNEWVSPEDYTKYRSAVDTYTKAARSMMALNKLYGGTDAGQQKKQEEMLASLNKDLEGAQGVHSQFTDAKQFQEALKAAEEMRSSISQEPSKGGPFTFEVKVDGKEWTRPSPTVTTQVSKKFRKNMPTATDPIDNLQNLSSWARSGLSSFSDSFYKTADFFFGRPLQALGWEENPISELADWYEGVHKGYKEQANAATEAMGGGTGLSILQQLTEGTVAALPDLWLAMMTYGGSMYGKAAATGGSMLSKGLAATAAYNTGNTLTKAGLTAQKMMKNPQFWTSFARSCGLEYEEAVNAGVDPTVATFSALFTSLLNAGVEIGIDGGSGIQGLVGNVAKGNKAAVWDWVESSLEEGGEEILQGVISRGINKISGGDVKVLDGEQMLQEGAMGTAIGAILGGGGKLLENTINSANQAKQDTPNVGASSQIIRSGVLEDVRNPAAYLQREQLQNTVLESAQRVDPTGVKMVSTEVAQTVAEAAVALNQNVRFATLDADFVKNGMLGMYDRATDTVLLNPQVPETELLGYTMAHEMTHSAEGTKQLATLAQTVRRMVGETEWQRMVEKTRADYAEAGIQLTEDGVQQETLADWVGENLFKDGFAQRVVEHSVDTGNWFVRVIDKLRRALGMKNSQSARNIANLERLFMQAIENKQGARSGDAQYAIVALGNGNLYVKATRNVIQGETKAEQRREITEFFNKLLEGNPSIDVPTIEGDVLTITKSETAKKARDDYKQVNGQSVPMTDEEFAVKLRAEAHIDELAEIAETRRGKSDTKNHTFAKDGFTYRRAYFADFDGKYYEITLSIGKSGTIATVYNVGKIEKGVLPSAKIIAVVGSKPLGKTPSNTNIPQNTDGVNPYSMQDGTENSQYALRRLRDTTGGVLVDKTPSGADGATSLGEGGLRGAADTASQAPMSEEQVLERAPMNEAQVLEQASQLTAQGKAVSTANDVESIIDELGDDVVLRRLYNAEQAWRPTGTIKIEGRAVDAAAYVDAYEQSLPDDPAALKQEIQRLEKLLSEEIVRQQQEVGTLVEPSSTRLKINLQLFAANRKWDLLQIEPAEGGKKASRFYENRVKGKDELHTAELQLFLAGRDESYNPIGNKKTLDKANQRLRDSKYQQKLLKRLSNPSKDNLLNEVDLAAAQVLVKDAIDEGNFMVAMDLDSAISRVGTRLGRAVQSLSIISRMTPEGTLRFAQKTLKAEADYVIGEGANEGLDVLADDIADKVNRLSRLKVEGGQTSSHGDVRTYGEGFSTETEGQRYGRLKNRSIKVVQDKSESTPNLSLEELEHRVKSKAEKTIPNLAKEIGVLNRELGTPELDISFELTKGNGLKASLSHQLAYGGNYADFAKALINIDEILDNAVLLEQHTDKYAGTVRANRNLIQTSVLLGAFQDGESIIPVQFVIKQLADTPNKLYLTVALTKVETGVMGATTAAKTQQARNLLPVSEYSLADLFANINPQDAEFLKYVPDAFLDEGQIVAKKQAQKAEQARIESYKKNSPTREELVNALAEDLANEPRTYLTKDEIYDALWDVVENSTNIPEQVKRYVLKKLRKGDGSLAERLYRIYMKGDLSQVKVRRAIEQALELPTLTNEDVKKVVELATEVNDLAEDPVAQADKMDELYDFMASKMAVNNLDWLQAWRKFAMLANPKTHIRNFTANGAYVGVRKADDAVAMAIERIFVRDPQKRAAQLGWSHTEHGRKILPKLRKQAELAALEMQKRGAKYETGTGMLKNRRKFFGKSKVGEAFNKANRFNSEWLEREDLWFFKPAYIDALGQMMTAQKTTEITEEMHQRAMKRALDATFRAENTISEVISNLKGFVNKSTLGKRLFGQAVDVTIPFHKTPANIAAQTALHSPIGLAKGTFDLWNATRGKGSVEVADAINTFAKGVTGTALYGVGILLGYLGYIKIGYGSSEKERDKDELAGLQENALVIGDVSISLDWLQPAAAPFISGGAIGKALTEGDLSLESVGGSLLEGADSLFELTMLQSLYDVFGGYGAGVSSSLVSVGENMLSQSIPTLLGQLARAIDPVQRETGGDNAFEQALNQVMAKIPGLTYLLDPKLDVWGNEVYRTGAATSESALLNIAQQLGIPSNQRIGVGADDPISQEILRLYESTGTTSVIPSTLTRDEATDNNLNYVDANRLLGAINRKAVEDFINDEWPYTVQVTGANGKKRNATKYYSEMTDDERRRVLSRIYERTKKEVKTDGEEDEPKKQPSKQDRYFEELFAKMQKEMKK